MYSSACRDKSLLDTTLTGCYLLCAEAYLVLKRVIVTVAEWKAIAHCHLFHVFTDKEQVENINIRIERSKRKPKAKK